MTIKKATRLQRKGAKEILRLGEKAFSYRKDLLSQDEAEELESSNLALAKILKTKPILFEELDNSAKRVDQALQKSGGLYYHKKAWVENIEMLLVAAIVVIGIRSFFVQPFIIPTNSMFPSFFGMQPKLYEEGESVPTLIERGIDKIFLGASHYQVVSESEGALYLKLHNGAPFKLVKSGFPNGRFFIFPTTLREYIFEIGGKDHKLLVPAEFDLDELMATKFGGTDDLRDLRIIVDQDENFSGRERLKLSEGVLSIESELTVHFILYAPGLLERT